MYSDIFKMITPDYRYTFRGCMKRKHPQNKADGVVLFYEDLDDDWFDWDAGYLPPHAPDKILNFWMPIDVFEKMLADNDICDYDWFARNCLGFTYTGNNKFRLYHFDNEEPDKHAGWGRLHRAVYNRLYLLGVTGESQSGYRITRWCNCFCR